MSEEIFTFMFEDTLVHVRYPFYSQFACSIPRHSHSSHCYELHYIPSGKGILRVEGNEYPLESGVVCVTGPHVEHEQIIDSAEPMAEYCIFIQTGIPDRKNGSVRPVLDCFENKPFWVGKDKQGAGDVILRIFRELGQKLPGYRIQVCALLQQLIVCLVRNYEQDSNGLKSSIPGTDVKAGNPDGESFYDPWQYIDSRFLYDYNIVSLESLAKEIGLSVRQTERMIKLHYGMTFREKKRRARMSAAALMLSEGNAGLTEISEKLGYSSVEHFGAAFKDYYGVSPGKYKFETKR